MAWYMISEEFRNTGPVVPKWKILVVEHATGWVFGRLLSCFLWLLHCGESGFTFLFWQPEAWHQIHVLYRVYSLKIVVPNHWLTFFSFVWSTGILGKERPTVQFRCKRSNGLLWLSHCRPGFREMAESSWRGSAKCRCWFWWCGIKQPNVLLVCRG